MKIGVIHLFFNIIGNALYFRNTIAIVIVAIAIKDEKTQNTNTNTTFK